MRDSAIVTEEDMMLVHALQVNPRVSWAALGRVLGTSPDTLDRRWNRLTSAGLAWTTAAPAARSAKDGCLAYVGVSCAPAQTARVARDLADIPAVLSVEVTTGRYDLLLAVATADLRSMTDCLLGPIDMTPGVLKAHAMFVTTIFKVGTEWRLQSLAPDQVRELTDGQPAPDRHGAEQLGPLDGALRDGLTVDGRMSFTDLAERAGTSRNTARRRVDRMLRAGVFAIRCDLAGPAFGWPVSTALGIEVEPEQLAEVCQGIARYPQVRLVAALADRPNVLVSSWQRSLDGLPRFEIELSRRFPTIRIRDRYVHLYSTKRTTRILDEDGRARGFLLPEPVIRES